MGKKSKTKPKPAPAPAPETKPKEKEEGHIEKVISPSGVAVGFFSRELAKQIEASMKEDSDSEEMKEDSDSEEGCAVSKAQDTQIEELRLKASKFLNLAQNLEAANQVDNAKTAEARAKALLDLAQILEVSSQVINMENFRTQANELFSLAQNLEDNRLISYAETARTHAIYLLAEADRLELNQWDVSSSAFVENDTIDEGAPEVEQRTPAVEENDGIEIITYHGNEEEVLNVPEPINVVNSTVVSASQNLDDWLVVDFAGLAVQSSS